MGFAALILGNDLGGSSGLSWHDRLNLVPVRESIQCIEGDLCDFVGLRLFANFIVFVPGAALITLSGWSKPRHAILAAALLATLAEILQLALSSTRVGDIDDIIINTSGAALAVGLVAVLRTPVRRMRRRDVGEQSRP